MQQLLTDCTDMITVPFSISASAVSQGVCGLKSRVTQTFFLVQPSACDQPCRNVYKEQQNNNNKKISLVVFLVFQSWILLRLCLHSTVFHQHVPKDGLFIDADVFFSVRCNLFCSEKLMKCVGFESSWFRRTTNCQNNVKVLKMCVGLCRVTESWECGVGWGGGNQLKVQSVCCEMLKTVVCLSLFFLFFFFKL